MDIPFGKSLSARLRGGLTELPLINVFAEKAETEKEGIVLQSRKGLVEDDEVGSGPVRATMARDGVRTGLRYTVSGNEVYEGGTKIGVLPGDGPVSIAGDEDEVLFAAGKGLMRWDGTTFGLTTIGVDVVAVRYIAGYFIALQGGSQKWHFSPVGGGSDWQELDFASSENAPDRVLDVLSVDDTLVFLGSQTTEFWMRTLDADLPFAAVQQRVYEVGVIATGCALVADNSFFFIGSDGIVYRGGGVPEAISDDGVTEAVLASSTHALYMMQDGRHQFVAVRLDSRTLCFDLTTGAWCEFASWGRGNFRIACADGVMGDDETGKLWRFEGYADPETIHERRWRGGFPVDGGVVPLSCVRARAQVGATEYLTGTYAAPVIEMRVSRDGGHVFDDWEAAELGAQGDYRAMPEWRALGSADFPGVVFEWRVTDPVPFRFSGATLNERKGGLAR